MSLTYDYRPGHSLTARLGDLDLWTARFGTSVTKPHLHPVHTPAGRLITCAKPWDHHWHLGIWFCWKYLNGINVWEYPERADETGGLTLPAADEIVGLSPAGAALTMDLEYRHGDVLLATERRKVLVEEPRDGAYRMVFAIGLTAPPDQPLDLTATPVNEQTPWGGYAGMSWRAERSMALRDVRGYDSEGRSGLDIEHQRAKWVAYEAGVDGVEPGRAGLVMLDHPANPHHPCPWRYISNAGFGYTNAAIVCFEPLRLEPGETLPLLYRLLIHDGPWTPEACEAEWEGFAGSVG